MLQTLIAHILIDREDRSEEGGESDKPPQVPVGQLNEPVEEGENVVSALSEDGVEGADFVHALHVSFWLCD